VMTARLVSAGLYSAAAVITREFPVPAFLNTEVPIGDAWKFGDSKRST